MITYTQAINGSRKQIKRINKVPALKGKPQRKGIVAKIYNRTPKKPNSALRKISKLKFPAPKSGSQRKLKIESYIPGEGHNLKEYSEVLMRGGRVKDLPGVKYHGIRGKYDFESVVLRKQSRSRYGTKSPKKYLN